MAKKNNNASFLYRLYDKTGERYPIIILLILQSISIPLMIFLTSMPAQQNAEFNQTQGISLLIYGSVAILVRNLILFALFSFVNQDMLKSLSKSIYPQRPHRTGAGKASLGSSDIGRKALSLLRAHWVIGSGDRPDTFLWVLRLAYLR